MSMSQTSLASPCPVSPEIAGLPDRHEGTAPAREALIAPGDINWGAIDLNLLIVFDAVMHERNLTRAGRRLGLSQPAASHALARLRTTLKDDLFVRTPEGMQPTARAQQMAEPVRDALRMLRLTLEPEEFDPTVATRTFTIAANNHAARAIVPELARRVSEVAPYVSLNVQPVGFRDVLDQLDLGTDVALERLVDGGERFKCVRIMEDDFVAVFDRDHPAGRAPVFTAEQVAEIPHILTSSTGDDTSFIDEALEEHGLARKIAVRVPMLSIALMLVGSDSLAVLPRRVAVDLTRICPLAMRDLPFPSPQMSLAMIWHRRMDSHPAHRWLRGMIRSSVEQRKSSAEHE
jgi:DNA-binding transcriptional LysR family regulator